MPLDYCFGCASSAFHFGACRPAVLVPSYFCVVHRPNSFVSYGGVLACCVLPVAEGGCARTASLPPGQGWFVPCAAARFLDFTDMTKICGECTVPLQRKFPFPLRDDFLEAVSTDFIRGQGNVPRTASFLSDYAQKDVVALV